MTAAFEYKVRWWRLGIIRLNKYAFGYDWSEKARKITKRDSFAFKRKIVDIAQKRVRQNTNCPRGEVIIQRRKIKRNDRAITCFLWSIYIHSLSFVKKGSYKNSYRYAIGMYVQSTRGPKSMRFHFYFYLVFVLMNIKYPSNWKSVPLYAFLWNFGKACVLRILSQRKTYNTQEKRTVGNPTNQCNLKFIKLHPF